MSKFKVGDKVIVTTDWLFGVKRGYKSVVVDTEDMSGTGVFICTKKIENGHDFVHINENYLKLIEEGHIDTLETTTLKVKYNNASFDIAMANMRLGHLVRRKGWEGYWYLDDDLKTIRIAYKWFMGKKVNEQLQDIKLSDSEDMYATLLHTTANDWEVLEREE